MQEHDGGEHGEGLQGDDDDLAEQVERDPFLLSPPDASDPPDLSQYVVRFVKADAVEELCVGLRLRYRRPGAA